MKEHLSTETAYQMGNIIALEEKSWDIKANQKTMNHKEWKYKVTDYYLRTQVCKILI